MQLAPNTEEQKKQTDMSHICTYINFLRE